MRVHVQVRMGIPATDGCFAAWRALEDAGWEVRPFESRDEVVGTIDEPVVGGIANVVTALRRLGVTPPDVDYPPALADLTVGGPPVLTTMGAVRRTPERWPVFVKPTTGRKEFGGLVVSSTSDLLLVTHADDELPVFVSAPVDLRNRVEWRAFAIDGRVRDVRPYSSCADGDAPPLHLLQAMVDRWEDAPTGFALDVVNLGDREAPDWRLIECNDGYSLGHYGLHRMTYAELLAKRWWELTGSEESWL